MDHTEEPATKADIQRLQSELHGRTDQLRSEMKETSDQLRSEMHHNYDDLKETMRDVQTELLKAFYTFATTADARQKANESAHSGMNDRLTAVEQRVTELEKRLNLPPAA